MAPDGTGNGAKQEKKEAAPEVAATEAPATEAPDLAAVLAQLAATQARLVELEEQRNAAPPPSAAGARSWASMDAQDAMAELQGTVSAGPEPSPDDPDYLEEEAVFRATDKRHNVIRRSRNRITMPNGDARISEGVHFSFEPNGEFRTRSKAVVAYLKTRPGFNVHFWQVGAEPDRVPSPEGALRRLMEAMRDLDMEAIDAIEREEQQGHKRPIVLQSIEGARSALRTGAREGAAA